MTKITFININKPSIILFLNFPKMNLKIQKSLKLKDLIDANETVISVGKKKYFNVKVN